MDDAQFEDPFWRRRGDHPSPPVAVRFHCPAAFSAEGVCLGFGIDRADRFGRVEERRVFCIDLDLGQQGGEFLVLAEQVVEFLLQDIADHAASFGAKHIEGKAAFGVIRGGLQGKQADLWPVAMGNDDLMPCGDDVGDGFSGASDIIALVVGRHRLAAAQKRVAAQGDQDPHG